VITQPKLHIEKAYYRSNGNDLKFPFTFNSFKRALFSSHLIVMGSGAFSTVTQKIGDKVKNTARPSRVFIYGYIPTKRVLCVLSLQLTLMQYTKSS